MPTLITPLERNTTYVIGIGEKARPVLYLGREFPDDHPPVFSFMDLKTEEVHTFLLPQLAQLESQGGFHYGSKYLR